MFNGLKKSYKTTEFWIGLGAALLVAIFPDFPKESFLVLAGYFAIRTTEKAIGGDPAKRAWTTMEFWGSLGLAAVQYVFPTMDPTVLYSFLALIGVRATAKGARKRVTG